MDLGKKVQYVGDFDELTWLMDVEQHRFFECAIQWGRRKEMRKWIDDHCIGDVYIWNGNLMPRKGYSHNWGDLIAADGVTSFLIFTDTADEIRFAVEFAKTEICKNVHKNGIKAFYARRDG